MMHKKFPNSWLITILEMRRFVKSYLYSLRLLRLTRMSRKIRLSLHELVQIVKNNFDYYVLTYTYHILHEL